MQANENYENLKVVFDKNMGDLKLMYAVLKVPRMCDLFYKAEKKRMSDQ